MIDRQARNQIARLVQDYILGRVTEQDLDWGLPHDVRGDHTANEIVEVLAREFEIVLPWQKPGRINHKGPISRETRRALARIIMFLHTDLERPKLGSWQVPVVRDEHWPFASLDDYEQALKHPKLLFGKAIGPS